MNQVSATPVQAPGGNSGADTERQKLYKRREKLFVHYVGGKFQQLRLYTGWPLLLGYFFLPWISWHERQAVLFDLPARKFYIFGLTLWPQDFMLLAWLLMIAAFTLFLVTSIVGRLWCGYTCPQTVWTAVFLWAEKLTEGSSSRRRRLDKQPFNVNKLSRKAAKHFLWLGFAFLTGFTFVAYFSPARELVASLLQFETAFWPLAWIMFFTLATYVNAGWLREQVCIYMCPYARFQSAMIDKDTLVVTYDAPRGEPRGARKRTSQRDHLGDCISCRLCVQVCPTGIDIRDGLQIECIQCAHCIDACDQVMAKMNYASGLIRYDSERNVETKGKSHIAWLRGRTIGYGLVLLAMLALFAYQLGSRVLFSLDIVRERGVLFYEVQDRVRNDYTLKIANKSQADQRFSVQVSAANSTSVEVESDEIIVAAGEVQSSVIGVFQAKNEVAPISDITISLCESGLDQCVETTTRFIGSQL